MLHLWIQKRRSKCFVRSRKPATACGRKSSLLLVLDSNEYVFTWGTKQDPTCKALLKYLVESSHRIIIVRTILQEVLPNLNSLNQKRVFAFLSVTNSQIIEEHEVPAILHEKYKRLGLKDADAFIAAFTEHTNAEALITENRSDFIALHLEQPSIFPFKIWDAETALKHLKQLQSK